MTQTSIRENFLRINERIAQAAERAGRRAEEITLIGVSKTHPAIAIQEAYQAGVRHFGENRVQEWEVKRVGTNNLAATWHLIGHLQSNKAARAAKLFHSVDSVDDFALAQKLDRARAEAGVPGKLRVLIEVSVAQEETKSGAEIEALPGLAEEVAGLPRLELAGLMCIPPFFPSAEAGLQPGAVSPAEAVRPYFRRLQELRDELTTKLGLALPVLSMGMSHDFEVAIEEGATEVRVGTALFGTRETQ
jgi:pyridoxal phosphate enzyme (YggS family)